MIRDPLRTVTSFNYKFANALFCKLPNQCKNECKMFKFKVLKFLIHSGKMQACIDMEL